MASRRFTCLKGKLMEKKSQLLACDLTACMERNSSAVFPIGCNSVSLAVQRQVKFSGTTDKAFGHIFGHRQQYGIVYLLLAFVGPTQLQFSFFLVH